MGLLKDQHNGLQQALAMRVKELEAVVGRLKQQYRSLDERRGLEVEGFASEVALLQKQVARPAPARPPRSAHPHPPPAPSLRAAAGSPRLLRCAVGERICVAPTRRCNGSSSKPMGGRRRSRSRRRARRRALRRWSARAQRRSGR